MQINLDRSKQNQSLFRSKDSIIPKVPLSGLKKEWLKLSEEEKQAAYESERKEYEEDEDTLRMKVARVIICSCLFCFISWLVDLCPQICS